MGIDLNGATIGQLNLATDNGTITINNRFESINGITPERINLNKGTDTTLPDDILGFFEDMFRTKLRAIIFSRPTKETNVQDAIETLFIGNGWTKGINYDRETGKVLFSGKEYIPDFIIPGQNMCIEVKLLREGKKSEIIEQINSDITGYGKKYSKQLFLVYDLGVIRDEKEFKRDIENSDNAIRVVIIKH